MKLRTSPRGGQAVVFDSAVPARATPIGSRCSTVEIRAALDTPGEAAFALIG